MKKRILRLLPFLMLILLLAGCVQDQVQPTAPPTEAPTAPTEFTQATEAAPERFVLTFVGDCTLGTHPGNFNADVGFVKLVGEDYRYPFANVIGYFETDECSFVNLEGPCVMTELLL